MSSIGKGFGAGIGFIFGIIAVIVALPIVFIAGCAGLAVLFSVSQPRTAPEVASSSISFTNSQAQAVEHSPSIDDQAAQVLSFSTNVILDMMDGASSVEFSGDALPWGYHQWRASGNVKFQANTGAVLHWTWAVYSHIEDEKLVRDYSQVGSVVSGTIPDPVDSPEEAARKERLRELEQSNAIVQASNLAASKAAHDAANVLNWQKDQAASGNAAQQYNLGVRYLSGDGVAKDPRQARAWFAKAAAQGDPDALAALTNSPQN